MLGIDIKTTDIVVLSHGHWDHGNGLSFIEGEKPLICHPGCFVKRYRKKDNTYIGLKYSQEEIENNFNLILSKTPYQISEDIVFLGEIPRINSFEAKETPFCLDGGIDDFVLDDSGLAIISNAGLIIISGCAHSGICNTIEYAKKVTGITNVYAAIGGFHLKNVNDACIKTIEYLRVNKAQKVFPCHCVEHCVIEALLKQFPNESLYAGGSITL